MPEIEDMMAHLGLVLHHAPTPAGLPLPVTLHGSEWFLDAEVTEINGQRCVTGHHVRNEDPLFYLTGPEGKVLALLQYGWHTNVPPPGRVASAGLLYVFEPHRRNGLGTILTALAIREAAKDGPFSCGGFIDDFVPRNIHYKLCEDSRPPIAEEDFCEEDGIDANHVRNGERAKAVARMYLERLLTL